MPSTLSILVNVFLPGERTKVIAIWASLTGAVGAIAPPVSGWLLEHCWYSSVFLINVPNHRRHPHRRTVPRPAFARPQGSTPGSAP
jgi:hypothetical protein